MLLAAFLPFAVPRPSGGQLPNEEPKQLLHLASKCPGLVALLRCSTFVLLAVPSNEAESSFEYV